MIRQQAFIHFNEQPFVQEYVDMVYDLAIKVDTAQSYEKDPINERHSDVSWIDPNRKPINFSRLYMKWYMRQTNKPAAFPNIPIESCNLHNMMEQKNRDMIGMLIV